jgi:DNA repair protein RadC
MFLRGTVYWIQDNESGKQETLRTKDRIEAERLFNAKNEAHRHRSRSDPTPSDADIKVTRDLIRAGQILKIEVLDHLVMGNSKHCSLRELGHFYL